MSETLFKILVPIGVLLTFLGSVLTIFYTRKNLKTSKYIETITTERIKWIEKVRIELSDILAELQEFIKLNYSLYKGNSSSDGIVNENNFENMVDRFHAHLENDKIQLMIKSFPSKELIRKIVLFKLRLNPDEDNEIIIKLDYYIYLLNGNATKEELLKGWNDLDEIIKLFQQILRSEWIKAKQEAKR
jgi:hypothetical protein